MMAATSRSSQPAWHDRNSLMTACPVSASSSARVSMRTASARPQNTTPTSTARRAPARSSVNFGFMTRFPEEDCGYNAAVCAHLARSRGSIALPEQGSAIDERSEVGGLVLLAKAARPDDFDAFDRAGRADSEME